MTITPSPSDNTTLTALLEDFARAGFDGQLTLDDRGVRCVSCGTTSEPGAIELRSLRRLEGASDPADMAAVLAVTCPACGRRGTLVVMYGPEASVAEEALLTHMHDRRFEDDVVPGAAGTHEGAAASQEQP